MFIFSSQGDVFMYYGLTNYYQNHRRYVKSRDDNQLAGQKLDKLNSECEPYRYNENETAMFAPCGAIANSLFNGKSGLKIRRCRLPLNSPAAPSNFCREPKNIMGSIHNTCTWLLMMQLGSLEKNLNFEPCKCFIRGVQTLKPRSTENWSCSTEILVGAL